MRRTIRKSWPLVLGLATLAALTFAGWWLLGRFWSYLSTTDASVVAALLTGVLVAIGAICVKHLEHRHSVEAQFRDSKVELFNEFMTLFDEFMDGNPGSKKAVATLKKWNRKLLFWGGPSVVKAAIDLRTMQSGSTVGTMAASLEKIGTLILAMRRDLGLSNRGVVSEGPDSLSLAMRLGARYILRNPDLFFQCLRENPSITMDELAKREAELSRKQGTS